MLHSKLNNLLTNLESTFQGDVRYVKSVFSDYLFDTYIKYYFCKFYKSVATLLSEYAFFGA